MENEKSQSIVPLAGVPQGTVLGPKLFNLFLFDFPHEDSLEIESKTILFADDTLTYAHSESPALALEKIKNHIQKICEYYKSWGISINPSKTELICIRNASGKGKKNAVKESKDLKITIENLEISVKNIVKYLGVNFNNLHKFNNHARIAINKSKKAYHLLRPLLTNKSLGVKTKLLLYKALIKPLLTFSFPNWFSISPVVVKEMEILERSILRKCLNMNFESTNKRFSNKKLYEAAKMAPLANYLTETTKKFIKKLEHHSNHFLREIHQTEKSTPIQNNYYISPVNMENPNSTSYFNSHANETPQFYRKVTHQCNRG
jgi:hypothetical protein